MTTIPLPADATTADNFEIGTDGAINDRLFWGTQRESHGIEIQIFGYQRHSGSVRQRGATLRVNGTHLVELEAAQLRQVAANALAVADELDALRGIL